MIRLLSLLTALSVLAISPAHAEYKEACPADAIRVTTSEKSDFTSATLKDFNWFSQQATDAEVVVLGDSISREWPDEMLSELTGRKTIKFGFWGDSVQIELWRVGLYKGLAPNAKLVILMIGTNNLPAPEPPCAISVGILNLTKAIQETWPSAQIAVFGILPRGDRFEFRNRDRVRINEEVKAGLDRMKQPIFLNDDNAITCGLIGSDEAYYRNDTYGCDNYGDDLLHLTPSGYTVLGKLLVDALPSGSNVLLPKVAVPEKALDTASGPLGR